MKKSSLLCSMLLVIAMTSCEEKDSGKITSEKVDAAYRSAGYAVASADAYNGNIDDKNLETVWYVTKDVGDDNVSGKIYVFSNSKAKNAYWEAWEATYPNHNHDFTAVGVQNTLLTEIRVNGIMSSTLSASLRDYNDFDHSGPSLSDDLVKGLTGVLSSIKY